MRKTLTAALAALALFGSSARTLAQPVVPGEPYGFAGHFYGAHHYCWYENAWHGPGFYWCGYALRRGHGWGGPQGWQGWHGVPGWRDGYSNHRHHY